MRWARFAIFVLIVTVLQAGLADIIAVTNLNIKPDLLLIILVFFALYRNPTEAIITSFTIGFAADIISTSTMGTHIISFGLLGTSLSYLHRVIAIRRMPYQSIAIFISGMLSGIFVIFLTRLVRQPLSVNILAVLFWTSLYSSVVGPFLFLPSAWWMRIRKHKV